MFDRVLNAPLIILDILDVPVEVRSQLVKRKVSVSFFEVYTHRKHENDSLIASRDIFNKTLIQKYVTRKEVFKSRQFDFIYYKSFMTIFNPFHSL